MTREQNVGTIVLLNDNGTKGSFWLSLLLGVSRYIEKKLSECMRKNDEGQI